jgi:hypothetical protein
MRDFAIVLVHLIVTLTRLARSGGLRSVVAESVLPRQQLLILNRGRKRAPNLRVSDRIIAGLCSLLIHPSRMLRCAIVLKPSTLLHRKHTGIEGRLPDSGGPGVADKLCLVSLAEALSRAVPDTDCSVIL